MNLHITTTFLVYKIDRSFEAVVDHLTWLHISPSMLSILSFMGNCICFVL